MGVSCPDGWLNLADFSERRIAWSDDEYFPESECCVVLCRDAFRPGYRYWGFAATSTSGNSYYEPFSVSLYVSTDRSGEDLARGQTYFGRWGRLDGESYEVDGSWHFLQTQPSEPEWYETSWTVDGVPIFYIDLGSQQTINSATHLCRGNHVPASGFIVATNDPRGEWQPVFMHEGTQAETYYQEPLVDWTEECPAGTERMPSRQNYLTPCLRYGYDGVLDAASATCGADRCCKPTCRSTAASTNLMCPDGQIIDGPATCNIDETGGNYCTSIEQCCYEPHVIGLSAPTEQSLTNTGYNVEFALYSDPNCSVPLQPQPFRNGSIVTGLSGTCLHQTHPDVGDLGMFAYCSSAGEASLEYALFDDGEICNVNAVARGGARQIAPC